MFKNDFNAAEAIRFWAKFTRVCAIITLSLCGLASFITLCMSLWPIALALLGGGLGTFASGLFSSALLWGFADLVENSFALRASNKPAKSASEQPAAPASVKKSTSAFQSTPEAPKAPENSPASFSLTIPNGSTEIAHYAYYKCDTIKQVTIPKSVLSIGNKAFYQCTSLHSITYEGTVSDWEGLVSKGRDWYFGVPATKIVCSDGTVSLN